MRLARVPTLLGEARIGVYFPSCVRILNECHGVRCWYDVTRRFHNNGSGEEKKMGKEGICSFKLIRKVAYENVGGQGLTFNLDPQTGGWGEVRWERGGGEEGGRG